MPLEKSASNKSPTDPNNEEALQIKNRTTISRSDIPINFRRTLSFVGAVLASQIKSIHDLRQKKGGQTCFQIWPPNLTHHRRNEHFVRPERPPSAPAISWFVESSFQETAEKR